MNQPLSLLRPTSALTFLLLCAAMFGCKSQGTQAPLELHPAPVPSEGPSRDKASDASLPALPAPSQVEKLEEALGNLQAVPIPVR